DGSLALYTALRHPTGGNYGGHLYLIGKRLKAKCMELLPNYIDGGWRASNERQAVDVINPATQQCIARVPYGGATARDVDEAVAAASKVAVAWAELPVMQRVQPLYRLKVLLEEHLEELAETITNEC